MKKKRKKRDKQRKETLWINCGDHDKRPWYVVCKHVLAGAAPFLIEKPVEGETTGTVICQECSKKEATVEDLAACCDRCVETKILPVRIHT